LFRAHVSLGKIRGIPIRIDASWIAIFVLVTWSVARSLLPSMYPHWSLVTTWALGVVASILFFVAVLVHELAHSLVALAHGLPVRTITLFIFGGVSEIEEEPEHARTEFLVALAGPLSSLLLGLLLLLVAWVSGPVSEPLGALAGMLGRVNITLAVFNLIPGFPLDGGRVLRAFLWGLRRDLTWATRWATRVGQLVAMGFIILGVMRGFSGDWVNGIWLVFVGAFLDNAARASYGQLTLRNLLSGHVVGEVMTGNCQVVPPYLTIDVFVDHFLMAEGRRCFPVGTRDEVEGLLTIHNVRAIPQTEWREKRVSDAMTPMGELKVVHPDTPLWDALRDMTQEGVNQLPVMTGGELVGMISRENLVSFLHSRLALAS
jgi:Zn-dependent protease